MIALSVLLLSTAEPAYRGRVSGVRMLAVYGLPMGLLLAGALIETIGITATLAGYGVVGVLSTLWVVKRWPAVARA